MNLFQQFQHDSLLQHTRRHFLRDCTTGLGALWFASMTGRAWGSEGPLKKDAARPLLPHQPPRRAKAKRVIYLHMAGAPSQLDLLDYKPKLVELDGQRVPESIIKGERFAFIKGVPRVLGTPHRFARHGRSGQEISEAVPHLAGGLVGERHRQQLVRGEMPLADEPGNPVDEYARFAGPGTGQHQQVPLARDHRLALAGVQGFQEGVCGHGARL